MVQVKFADRYPVRLRKGRPAVAGKALAGRRAKTLLDRLSVAQWVEMHAVGAARLAKLRALAQRNSRRPLPDLANWYLLALPRELDAFEIAAELMKLREVEYAKPMRRPAPPPVVPDFTSLSNPTGFTQGYLGPASSGVDAAFAWSRGADGAGVTVCDIEVDWDFLHAEFPIASPLVPLNPGHPPVNQVAHGTAVASVYGGVQDGAGVTGVAHRCAKAVVSTWNPFYNVAGAVTLAAAPGRGMTPGDIILIEQQVPGPHSLVPWPLSQRGMVAVEWDRAIYDAVRTVVQAGFIVIEGAGNGETDLDDAVYRKRKHELAFWNHEMHEPFTPAGDSGAILVGADTGGTRTKAAFSNWGSRVNVQSWGASVVSATAPGEVPNDLWTADGDHAWYSMSFGGTSSAAAIVAGVCACLQSLIRPRFGLSATPAQMRQILVSTGSPQTGSPVRRIGPQPDLRAAIALLDRQIPPAPTLSISERVEDPNEVSVLSNMDEALALELDAAIWYTRDDSDPVENGARSRRLARGHECAHPPPLPVDDERPVKVAAFGTSRLFGGRRRGPVARIEPLPPGPAWIRASQGEFEDKVRVEWSAVPGATGYRLTEGSQYGPYTGGFAFDMGSEHLSFADVELPADGSVRSYWVRARFSNGGFSRFSGPAMGWRGQPPLRLTSSWTLEDHVHLEWSAPALAPHLPGDLSYEVYRSPSPSLVEAAKIATILPGYRAVPGHDGGSFRLPVEPAREYADFDIVYGRIYFYWVRALDSLRNLRTPYGRPRAGGAGVALLEGPDREMLPPRDWMPPGP
jgi:subtilisin family serine protease